MKVGGKFAEEHPCGSVISIKLLRNFIEITLEDGFSTVKLLHISRILFTRTSLKDWWISSLIKSWNYNIVLW